MPVPFRPRAGEELICGKKKAVVPEDELIETLQRELKAKKIPDTFNSRPLSIGGADIPSNMRLLDDNFHYDIHHAKYKPWLNK